MNVLYAVLISLILLGTKVNSEFYGFSILFLFFSILIFNLFSNISNKFDEFYEKKYYFANKKLLFQSLIMMELIGIILSSISFYLSTFIEEFAFKILSLVLILYPIYFVIKMYLKSYQIEIKEKLNIIFYLLIPIYFIFNKYYITIYLYFILVNFLLQFLIYLILFICNIKKFYFNEKETREEVKYNFVYLIKEIFKIKYSFSLILIIKMLLDFCLIFIFKPLLSLSHEIFLREVISYFIYYPILLIPFILICKKTISKNYSRNINEDERKKKMEKEIILTSVFLIFVSVMLSFFGKDLIRIIYSWNTDIFSIISFSLFFEYIIYIFIKWNQIYSKNKLNKIIIPLYFISKIIVSFIFIKFSYLLTIKQFSSYFIAEEIILFTLFILLLKECSKNYYLSYAVLRYKIMKTTLCSFIVYALILNIKHLYPEIENKYLLSLVTIILCILGSFIYVIFIKKTSLLKRIYYKKN